MSKIIAIALSAYWRKALLFSVRPVRLSRCSWNFEVTVVPPVPSAPDGEKLALGLWEGSSENAAVTAALLPDLLDRGVDVEQGLLFVIEGSKALRKAIRQI